MIKLQQKKTIRSKEYNDYIRSLTCTIDSFDCQGDVVPAHIGLKERGMGLKASDIKEIPLCYWHHAEEHRGTKTFFDKYNIDPQREIINNMGNFIQKLLEEGRIK